MSRRRGLHVGVVIAILTLPLAACSSSSKGSAFTPAKPPTRNGSALHAIGKGERKLNVAAWEGYLNPQWVKPFEKQTGCKVNAKYASTSSQMVSMMTGGGNGQFDLVSASGDAGLDMIYKGDVRPVNVDLVPSWKDFRPFLKSPAFNTIDGVHYGVTLEFGPNVLVYSTSALSQPPTSWGTLYSKQYAHKISIANNPMQIADAALYLAKSQPSLGITDPYELTKHQFNAAIDLLKQQRPLVKKYWNVPSEQETLFQNHAIVAGEGWPIQVGTLKSAGFPVAETIPSEGATGWADSWMLAAKARHPNCAYLWLQFISMPIPQAQQALAEGQTPANALACSEMNQMRAGSCASLDADKPDSYFTSVEFWKTPLQRCDNGKNDCVPIAKWVSAWALLTR